MLSFKKSRLAGSNLIKSLVLVTLLFAFGCNDLPPTEPSGASQKFDNPVIKEVLDICCPVSDPIMGACQVNGEVTYVHEIVENQSYLNGLSLVRVQIDMDSELCDMYGMVHLEWRIVGNSVDLIYISEDGIYLLEKVYPICHRNECVLVVQYLVTTEGVGIPNMWITQIDEKENSF